MSKGALVVAGVTFVGLLGFAFAGGGGGAPAKRPPYRGTVLVPGRNAPWDPVDEALCLCSEAEDATGPLGTLTLARCVLKRVWPDVPWPVGKADSPSAVETQRVVTQRTDEFRVALRRGERPCDPAVIDNIDFIDPVEPPPPPAGEWDVVDPFSDGAERGKFARIAAGSNPTKLVRAALGGLAAGDARVQRALRCMASTGWNLYFYSRPRAAASHTVNIAGRHFDVGPAWNPANQNMREAWNDGVRPLRRVGWSGASAVAGSYGAPWLGFDAAGECAVPGDPWAPENNPPAEAIERMGHNLSTMRDVWMEANT